MEGTVIHKSGLITGGISGVESKARRWDEKDIEALKRAREEIMLELDDVGRSKRRLVQEETIDTQVLSLEGVLNSAKADLVS